MRERMHSAISVNKLHIQNTVLSDFSEVGNLCPPLVSACNLLDSINYFALCPPLVTCVFNSGLLWSFC